MDGDEALSPDKLKAKINGLSDEILDQFGAEYGLERTESGDWTVNEALDNEVEEKMGSPLARITGSVQSGGW